MNSERVNEIRAALDAEQLAFVNDDYALEHGYTSSLDYPAAISVIHTNSVRWLRGLLAEVDRLQAVVEAAREVRLYMPAMAKGAELEADERVALEALATALVTYDASATAE